MAADSKLVVFLKLDGTELGKGITRAQKDVSTLGIAFSGVGLAAAAAVKMAATFQDTTIKAARAAGIVSSEFSAMAYAAGLSGVSSQELGKSLVKLQNPMGDASQTLRDLGINAKDASGKVKGQTQLMGELADKFEKISDPAIKSQAALRIFGEEGVKMVSMLEGGKKGLSAAAKEAEDFGQTVSEKAGKNAELFNDNISKAEKGLTGFRNVIAETAIEMANSSGVMDGVNNALKNLISGWRNLDQGTKETILKIGAAVGALGGLLLVFTAIAAALPALAAGFTLMLGPVGLVVLAIAAVTAAAMALENQRLGSLKTADAFLKSFEEQNRVLETAGANYRELEGTSSKYQSSNAAVRQSVRDLNEIASKYNVSLTDQNGNYKKLADVMDEVNRQRVKEAALGLAGLGILEAKTRAEIRALETTLENFPAALRWTDQYRMANVLLAGRKKELDAVIESEKKLGVTIQEANRKSVAPKAKEKGPKLTNKDLVPPEIAFKSDIISAITAVDTVRSVSFQTSAEQRAIEAKRIKNEEAAYYSLGQQTVIAYAKVAESIAKTAQAVIKPFGDLTSAIADGIMYDAEVASRDLDVVANRAAETYNAQKEALEQAEAAKIAALAESFDSQIRQLEDNESRKYDILERGANERLLLLDDEYQKARDAAQIAFETQLEQDKANYEMKTAELDAQALDREQKKLTETIMEEDARLLKEQREKEHEERLSNLAKEYSAKTKGVDDELKAAQKAGAEKNKVEIEALTNAKNAALEVAETEKNAKMKALDTARAAEEKAIEKKRLETQYNAQMDAFNATKGIKIAETIASGAAAAAQAFVSMTAAMPFGLGQALGGIVAGVILSTTAMRVGQISSQQPIKPAGLLEDGGFIGGTGTHANGGDYNAKVEAGEFYLDRGRTSKMLKAIDSGMGGGGGIQITFQAGAIQGDIRDERTLNTLAVRLGNLIQRQMVSA